MEMTQFQKDLVRMWDSLRTDDKGSDKCGTIPCNKCHLRDSVCEVGSIFNAEKAVEIVTQWAKEHPVVTNEQKYKEVWGVEPKVGNEYLCPLNLRLMVDDCPMISCLKCKENFWNSEYKEPKKEGE